MSTNIFDDASEYSPETQVLGDQTLPPPLGGTDIADPVIDDVASTLVPLIERAAKASESLREAVVNAGPMEESLRATLGQIGGMLDRAETALPALEERGMLTGVECAEGAENGAETVRAMIETAVENLGARCQMQLDLARSEIDLLAKEIGSKIDSLAARMDALESAPAPAAPIPQAPAPDDSALQPMMDQSLAAWESQVGELLRLFREKAELTMSNIDELGRTQAEALDALCARAERLLSAPGRDAGNIVQVLDEVVNTIEPWRGLLVEGKCGSELAPAIAAIVEKVRTEVRGDIGRLDATVNEVVAITSRLADQGAPVAVAQAIAPAAPKAKPARAPAKPAPTPAKAKPASAKSKNSK